MYKGMYKGVGFLPPGGEEAVVRWCSAFAKAHAGAMNLNTKKLGDGWRSNVTVDGVRSR